MAHRTVVDLFLGRHYCPACGARAGFRQDFNSNKAKVRWYQLAAVRLFCNACGVEVRGSLGSGVWAIPLWTLLGGAFIVSLYGYGYVGPGSAQLLVVAFIVASVFIVQYFLRYEIVGNAP